MIQIEELQPDLLVTGGTVITCSDRLPTATAVAVKRDRVLWVGRRQTASTTQMREEVLRFVEDKFKGDEKKIAWVRVTLHQTPNRVVKLYKALRANPDALVQALSGGDFPCEFE